MIIHISFQPILFHLQGIPSVSIFLLNQIFDDKIILRQQIFKVMFVAGDEDIEALLGDATMKSLTRSCPSNNRIERFCTNEKCKQDASCCGEEQCKDCERKHSHCSFIDLKRLTRRVEERIFLCRKVIREFFRVEDEIINQLSASRKALIEKYRIWRLEQENSILIDSIFFKANPKNLQGKQIKSLLSQLSSKSKEIESDKYFLEFKQEGEATLKKLISLRQNLIDKLLKNKRIDSRILKENREGKEKQEYLLNQLENPLQLKLLFRASQHDFLASKFHQFCDSIPDTVTIVLTEYNRIIAAYTPLKWGTANGEFVADPSCRSFLLQLELREKMMVKSEECSKAIYDKSDCGPYFGGECADFAIRDNCHQKGGFYSYFSRVYNCEGKYKSNIFTYGILGGASECRVLEYEVFQVIR